MIVCHTNLLTLTFHPSTPSKVLHKLLKSGETGGMLCTPAVLRCCVYCTCCSISHLVLRGPVVRFQDRFAWYDYILGALCAQCYQYKP